MALAQVFSGIQRLIPPVCAAASAAHTGPLRGGVARGREPGFGAEQRAERLAIEVLIV